MLKSSVEGKREKNLSETAYVITDEKSVLNIPNVKVILVFIDKHHSDEILETPGEDVNDIKLLTVQTCRKMGGRYTKNLGFHIPDLFVFALCIFYLAHITTQRVVCVTVIPLHQSSSPICCVYTSIMSSQIIGPNVINFDSDGPWNKEVQIYANEVDPQCDLIDSKEIIFLTR
jgi:hypothetical protein